MTISYNWLCDYLPIFIQPGKLSDILTSVGLEVENMEKREEVTGGMEGLVIGEVIECEKHPGADKLHLTKVDIGNAVLQIVCGAPNVAKGQKIIVAPVGSTIYPLNSIPIIMKKAKIRGVESEGMICAEDEIGIGPDHSGILVIPSDIETGIPARDYFNLKSDWIFEIAVTPNRMEAMSHIGVAKNVCAWYSHHNNNIIEVKSPISNSLQAGTSKEKVEVVLQDLAICQRYSGICITGITVKPSPGWLIEKLKSIGLKSINNIVDVTNFILHETGQPLHAFDLESIKEKKIIVQQLPEGTPFTTLDEKVRSLYAEDIIICNGAGEPMCIGGVFGGISSGVRDSTRNIFLESANFNPSLIRKTILKHGLRTDAATRFEKGADISVTVAVLNRAALLIKQIAGGEISTEITDIYPEPKDKTEVTLFWDYLMKISGKQYLHDDVLNILKSLGFEIISINEESITVKVPHSNPDICLQADIIEEIMRIDGLENIEIPEVISIAPSFEKLAFENSLKEKIGAYLSGNGFSEILTNSITNSKYYDEQDLIQSARIINSLSVELDIMKPQMLHNALECIAYNINRKNNPLFLFEFGKTYKLVNDRYLEEDHLLILISENKNISSWKQEQSSHDIFYLKGLFEKIALLSGIEELIFNVTEQKYVTNALQVSHPASKIGWIGHISEDLLNKFSIKQSVLCIDIHIQELIYSSKNKKIIFEEISKFPVVQRELSIVVDRSVPFEKIQKTTLKAGIQKLKTTTLLNIFESEKLGNNKKSFALSYIFMDKEKTLTDKEIDQMMTRLINLYENELEAQIRKS